MSYLRILRQYVFLAAAVFFVFSCLGLSTESAFGQNAISTGTNAGFRMYYPGSNNWWIDPSGGRFDIRANGGSPLATINVLGNLGIGTTNPTALLDVATGAASAGIIIRANGPVLLLNNLSSPAQFAKITANSGAGGNYNGLWLASNEKADGSQGNASLPSWAVDVGGLDNITYAGSADTFNVLRRAAGGGYSRLLTINSSGNVGIGTTNPGSNALQVVGNVLVNGIYPALTVSGTGGVGSIFNILPAQDAQKRTLFYGESHRLMGFDETDNSWFVYTNNVNRMHIDSSGNVGIGTGGPSQSKLTVLNGNIQIATNTGTSYGIVFQDGSVQTTAAGAAKTLTAQTFAAAGSWTWVRPSGVATVLVTLVGGGGGGGGGGYNGLYNAGGGGGAGQAYYHYSCAVSGNVTVTVGAAGVAGTGSAGVPGNPGGDGGNSSFGACVTAAGGKGGGTIASPAVGGASGGGSAGGAAGNNSAGGNGATGTGDMASSTGGGGGGGGESSGGAPFPGGNGGGASGFGVYGPSAGATSCSTYALGGGGGGSSSFGKGGNGSQSTYCSPSVPASPGSGYGSGGGGNGYGGSSAAGAGGLVIVEWLQ